jgi:hypothetical protein
VLRISDLPLGYLAARRSGYVRTQWLLFQIITSGFKGSGPAAAANAAIFADSALSLIYVEITQTLQHLRITPDLPQRRLPDITAVYL